MNDKTILCVEDNVDVQLFNKQLLEKAGYAVKSALTLAEARDAVCREMPELILLDIHMTDGNGIDFLRELRKTSDIPVLLLTGMTTPQDVIHGLTEGGDDYLTKPYDFGILLARIEALMRRAANVPGILARGSLRFDILANRASLDGADLLLTQKEFAVLLLLVRNDGRALSPEYIYETVWKQPMAGNGSAVKNMLSRLRRKLGDRFPIEYGNDGEGYRFTSSDSV